MFNSPFSFKGRIRRTEFGISFIIYCAYYLLLKATQEHIELGGELQIEHIGILILSIPTMWFFLAQGCKRCHDRNNNGFYQIIPLYILWMLFGLGDKGRNDYGDDPKGKNPYANDWDKEIIPEKNDKKDESPHPNKLITIKTYNHPFEAGVEMSKLDSEGIFCFLKNELTSQIYPYAVGGAELQVPEEDVERALELLNKTEIKE